MKNCFLPRIGSCCLIMTKEEIRLFDENRRTHIAEEKAKTRKRIRVKIDPNNYDYVPVKKSPISIILQSSLKRFLYMYVFPLTTRDKPHLLNYKRNTTKTMLKTTHFGNLCISSLMKVKAEPTLNIDRSSKRWSPKQKLGNAHLLSQKASPVFLVIFFTA